MLVVNDDSLIQRAEVIWEKGTNRAAFFRGEVNKYGWVDTGSSFLPSELIAAFLWAQLEQLDIIQDKRKKIWKTYFESLKHMEEKSSFSLPIIPDYAFNNAHMFYLVCNSLNDRTKLIEHLRKNNVLAVFHYLSLHKSDFYRSKHDGRELKNADKFSDCLVRLPLFFDLAQSEIEHICSIISQSP